MATGLARKLGFPHVEFDALNWEMAPEGVFRERVSSAIQGDRWVVDGNYSKVRDLVWGRADTVVWLDYSLPVTMWRLLVQTLRRVLTGEEL